MSTQDFMDTQWLKEEANYHFRQSWVDYGDNPMTDEHIDNSQFLDDQRMLIEQGHADRIQLSSDKYGLEELIFSEHALTTALTKLRRCKSWTIRRYTCEGVYLYTIAKSIDTDEQPDPEPPTHKWSMMGMGLKTPNWFECERCGKIVEVNDFTEEICNTHCNPEPPTPSPATTEQVEELPHDAQLWQELSNTTSVSYPSDFWSIKGQMEALIKRDDLSQTFRDYVRELRDGLLKSGYKSQAQTDFAEWVQALRVMTHNEMQATQVYLRTQGGKADDWFTDRKLTLLDLIHMLKTNCVSLPVNDPHMKTLLRFERLGLAKRNKHNQWTAKAQETVTAVTPEVVAQVEVLPKFAFKVGDKVLYEGKLGREGKPHKIVHRIDKGARGLTWYGVQKKVEKGYNVIFCTEEKLTLYQDKKAKKVA